MSRIMLKDTVTLFRKDGSSIQFHIKAIAGNGASCVVYRAICDDNTEHFLKEYYPRNLLLERRENGSLDITDTKKEQFEKGLKRFKDGVELQKKIRLSEKSKNFTANVQGVLYGYNTEYVDMTVTAGRTYDKVGDESLHTLVLRMKTLAQVIGHYHEAGLLHLDIKPENIFVRPEDETVEDVLLFDCDSVIEKSKKMTVPALSYTTDWAAPEQLLSYKRSSICEATDLFSIGEIIFSKIFGRHSTQAERRSFSDYDIACSAEILKNVNPKIVPLLKELFRHTICAVPQKRYQTAVELIAKLDEIIKLSDPKEPFLKTSLPVLSGFFAERDTEIQAIHEAFTSHDLLFLSGLGGIGKTELAKRFAEKYKDEYDAVIFAPFVNGVQMMIADDNYVPICNVFQYPEEEPNEYFNRKLHELRKLCDKRTLLIIDNLDTAEDPHLNKLFNLECKMLVTTRMDFSDIYPDAQINIGTLTNPTKIFNEHYKKPLSKEERRCVDEIIEIVCGHTMVVELLAKQMIAGRIKPEKMLAKLKEGGISDSGKEKVRTNKDGNMTPKSLFSHIQALFDLSELDEDEKYVLSNLSLIPHTGISSELFCEWCEIESFDAINNLTIKGLVRLDKEKDYISLHPLIGEVVHDTLNMPKKTWEQCLKNARKFADDIFHDIPPVEKYAMIPVFRNMLSIVYNKNIASKTTAYFFRVVADVLSDYGNLDECEKYLKKSLDIRLELFGGNDINTATSYTSLGDHYANIGLYEKAEENYCIALHIKESLFGKDSFSYGRTLKDLGTMYRFSRKYEIAEEYLIKARQIYVSHKGEDSFEVSKVDLQLAGLYSNTGRTVEAEKLLSDILRKRESKGYQTRIIHHALGTFYRDIGEYEKAIYHAKRNLSLERERYVEYHSSVARSYSSLGMSYLLNGDTYHAEEMLKKALDIRKQLYGDEHWRTAMSYYRMGLLYEKIAEYQLAKEHYQKAFEIRSMLFGIDDADTRAAKEKADAMATSIQKRENKV